MTIGGREVQLGRLLPVYVIVGFFFGLPWFFIPAIADAYTWPKVLLLLTATIVTGAWWLWANLKSKVFSLSLSPFLSLLAFLNLVFFLSSWLASGNVYLSILMMSLPFLLASLFFVVVSSMDLPVKVIRWALMAVVASGAVLALIAVYQYFDLISLVISWPPLVDNKLWSPIGGVFNLIYYLIISLLAGIMLAWREKHDIKRVFYVVASFLILLAMILTLSLVLGTDDKYRLQLPPMRTSWSIGLEVLKQSPLLGMGPGMFINALSRFRDVSYNLTDVWNRKFIFATNTPLHLLAETGFLGLIGWLIFWWSLFKVIRSDSFRLRRNLEGRLLSFILTASFIYQLILPSTTFVWIMILAFLALYVLWSGSVRSSYLSRVLVALEAAKVESDGIRGYKSGMVLNVVAGLILAGLIGLSTLFGLRYALAEYHYAKSLQAGQANDAAGLLRHLGRSINYYPWLPKYHASIAQIHQQIINNIIQKEAGSITDEDRQQLQTSVQVALLQAKAAVQLNPNNADSWAALARLYTNLIGLAQGADQWAVATYQQALALDPVNPVLRTNLTGLLYSLGRLDEAVEQGRLAVQSKPDYANGWFNLALVYEKKENYQQAHAAIQRVLQFLPLDSPDRQTAQDKLDEIKKKLEETTKKSQPPAGGPQPTESEIKLSPTPTPVLTQPTPIPTVTRTPLPVPESDVKPPITITPSLAPTP